MKDNYRPSLVKYCDPSIKDCKLIRDFREKKESDQTENLIILNDTASYYVISLTELNHIRITRPSLAVALYFNKIAFHIKFYNLEDIDNFINRNHDYFEVKSVFSEF